MLYSPFLLGVFSLHAELSPNTHNLFSLLRECNWLVSGGLIVEMTLLVSSCDNQAYCNLVLLSARPPLRNNLESRVHHEMMCSLTFPIIVAFEYINATSALIVKHLHVMKMSSGEMSQCTKLRYIVDIVKKEIVQCHADNRILPVIYVDDERYRQLQLQSILDMIAKQQKITQNK